MIKDSAVTTDITILGGGPTGLFAAFYSGMRSASCKIIDSMPMLGGRLAAVYPEKFIYDVAGFPKILAQDLVAQLEQQMKMFDTTTAVCLEETALSLTKNETEDGWILETQKAKHKTKTLLISAGVGSYTPKKHTAEGAEHFENKGVYYSILHKDDFKGLNVVVIGGGDSALDWAMEMTSIAKSVTLIHRSDRFRAHADSVEKLQKSAAKIILNTEIIKFSGQKHLQSITIKNLTNGQEEQLSTDAAVVMFGYNSALGKIKEWGLTLEQDSIVVNERMETNLPGVYAAGDIVTHPGKLKLITTGFAEAAIAVNFAKTFLNPKEKAHPLHSTTWAELQEKKKGRQN